MNAMRVGLVFTSLVLVGCGDNDPLAAPVVQYGMSPCIHCGMIISDERYAAATLVQGARGIDALLYDDIGDLLEYEEENPDLDIQRRWVHDHGTHGWIDADTTFFVVSKDLHTPMASGMAAFGDRGAAEKMLEEFPGRIVTFENLEWTDD